VRAQRLLLGLDGSRGSDAALDWCREYAPALDAEVVAVHVVDLIPFIGYPAEDVSPGRTLVDVHETMEKSLEEWVAPLRADGIPCRTLVVEGNPAAKLDAAAVEQECDLLVIGRRGHGGFSELVLGSVAHALAHHSHRPVVVVPTERRG
jgi:nucleotide-binding universal stress UspA family protein